MALGSNQPLVKMSTRNIPGGKGGRCMRLTTSPPSCAKCHEIWEPKHPGTLWATPGLLRDSFTFYRSQTWLLIWQRMKRCFLSELTKGHVYRKHTATPSLQPHYQITRMYRSKQSITNLLQVFTVHYYRQSHASTCWRVCGNNLNIVSKCAVSPVVHTSNISSCQKKNFFSFLVAVKNSIKVGPLVFLL